MKKISLKIYKMLFDIAFMAAAICTLLKDNYDIVKMIVVIALNGSCHVLNYIENDGKKYVVDAYAMTNKYKKFVPLETGEFKDFVSAKLHIGVLLKIDSLQDFFEFYRRYFKYSTIELRGRK